MRNFIMAAFAVLSLTFSSMVSAAPNLDVSVFSRHVWRGGSAGDVVSIQPSLTVPFDSTGTSLNIWGQVPINGGATEYDFTVAQEVGDYATVILTSYYYPSDTSPLLDVDSHDIEVGVGSTFGDASVYVGRVVSSTSVEGDTYAEVGYPFAGFDFSVGVGDGAYTDSGDFGLVSVGLSYTPAKPERGDRGAARNWLKGYGASFIYNPDSETPYFVVSKTW
jgi:hypothetical protein|tara:strand:- start:793 stop:1452 length:660 start_codon:yes stop_codon:yes gene_type:complete